MSKLSLMFGIMPAVILGFSAAAWGQDADIGSFEFKWACATCHGDDAKGNGPLSRELETAPPDLTLLAKKNGGVFPIRAVYDIIDGRKVIAAHGQREMPIWGAFNQSDLYQTGRLVDRSYDPEDVKRSRILDILDYLARIQEK